ncbi:hypothetical protein [Plesiomonas shigelloides]|uniref:hypothetical protein n=1 Tax=Plesiomonas shigelloides TaxID=703 RepID=UPI0012627699|nr:hypothetical protein [Plesiomonas shigelloides]KAB7695546.1 hypothetical protein GBN15_12000 [Plesiomonas shigelloides]
MIIMPPLASVIISVFAKVASTVGPMLAKYVPIMLDTLGKNLPKVINTIEAISVASNVLTPRDNANELGAKAIIAEKKPEDFDKINDYINYLRNDITLDTESLSQDPVDCAIRLAVGGTIALKGVNEALDADVSIPFLKSVSTLDLTPNIILSVIKSYQQNSLNLDDLDNYLHDKLSLAQANKHSDALVNAYQIANPNMDLEQAEDAVINLR